MEEVTLVEIPQMQVLGIRKKGHYRIIPELLGRIFEFAMKNHVQISGMPMLLMHERSREEALDADVRGTADVEVAVPVSGTVRPEGDIRFYTLPGGKMARIVHMGPYEGSAASYEKVLVWSEGKGLHITGPLREIYHNNPMEVRPEEIMTEILVPVG